MLVNEKPNRGIRERNKVGNLGCFKSYEITFVIILFSRFVSHEQYCNERNYYNQDTAVFSLINRSIGAERKN